MPCQLSLSRSPLCVPKAPHPALFTIMAVWLFTVEIKCAGSGTQTPVDFLTHLKWFSPCICGNVEDLAVHRVTHHPCGKALAELQSVTSDPCLNLTLNNNRLRKGRGKDVLTRSVTYMCVLIALQFVFHRYLRILYLLENCYYVKQRHFIVFSYYYTLLPRQGNAWTWTESCKPWSSARVAAKSLLMYIQERRAFSPHLTNHTNLKCQSV